MTDLIFTSVGCGSMRSVATAVGDLVSFQHLGVVNGIPLQFDRALIRYRERHLDSADSRHCLSLAHRMRGGS